MTKQELVAFGQRVKKYRKHFGISQKDFAKSINISGSFLSEIESGKTRASLDFFHNITKHYNVNLVYLLHGEGDMLAKQEGQLTLQLKDFGEYNEKIRDLLYYLRCSPLVKMAILEFFTKYLYSNEEIIKRDISKNKVSDNGGSCS